MNDATNDLVMNQGEAVMGPPSFDSLEEERLYLKQRLTVAFRAFGKFGFDEGVAGHITVRDPEHSDHFWVNPMGVSFKQMKVSNLIRVDHQGQVVEGQGLLNGAAFTIHANIHQARPEVMAVAHAHSLYGKSWSTLGRLLDPITQDACAFYQDHTVFQDYTGVVLDMHEGERIVQALGGYKAAILRNHGLITAAETVDAAAWWFITMERSCQAQLLAEAAGTPILIHPEQAKTTGAMVGSHLAGWFSFQPIYQTIVAEFPDLFE